MPSPKFGALPYLNFLPFIAGYQLGELEAPGELIYDNPKNLNQAIDQKKLDISLVSSIYYMEHRDSCAMIPDFCVATEECVQSVSFYTKLPLSELSEITIGLTPQSASSVALLKVLCKHFWHVSPQFETFSSIEEAKNFNAFLLIGDQALENPSFSHYKTIDLATAWYFATGLPFVFAVFVARKEVVEKSPEILPSFHAMLQKGLDWSAREEEKFYQLAKKQSGYSLDLLKNYFSSLRYRFNPRLAKGMGRFAALYETMPLLDEPVAKK